MAAQVQTQRLDEETSAMCRDPRCMLPATTVVFDGTTAYAMCDDHAAYYVELAAETAGEAQR